MSDFECRIGFGVGVVQQNEVRVAGSLFSNRLDKHEFRMDGRVGILLSAQTMPNTLSGIMRMSESAGALRYSWAQDLQQHRPTSNLDLNPLAGFLGPGRQQLRACLFSSGPLLTTTTLGFYSSVQHNCSGTTQASDLRGPEDTHNH